MGPAPEQPVLRPDLLQGSRIFYSYSLWLGGFQSGHLEGFIADESEEFTGVTSGEALRAKTWNHVAFTFDGAYLRLYVDGALLDTESAQDVASSEGPLYLGCWPSEGEHFKGRIDELRIYDRVLDAGEIGADSDIGLEASREGPVATYAFDENEGTIAHDYAGGHDGTVEGADWTSGKYGHSLGFENTEDCVSVPNAEDLQLSEEFTLEAWVKPENLGKYEPILVKETPGWFGYMLYLGLDTGGHLAGYVGEEGEVTRGTEGPVLADKGAWSHIAFSFDGAGIKLYVNGELVDATFADGPMPTTGQLSIGCSKEGEEHFNGHIDEVRIYGRALTEAEIVTELHSGIETPHTMLD